MLVGDLYFDWVPTPMTLQQFNHYHECSLTPSQFHRLKQAVPNSWHKSIIDGSADAAEPEKFLKVFKTKSESKVPMCISNFSVKSFYAELTSGSFKDVQKKFQGRQTVFYTELFQTVGHVNWQKIFRYLYFNHLDKKNDRCYLSIYSLWNLDQEQSF